MPVEVSAIQGTSGDDVINATEATAEAHLSAILGKDGDDLIIRDRTGNYQQTGNSFGDVNIYGDWLVGTDTGYDTISYAPSSTGLSANLTAGLAQSDAADPSVAFGYDILRGIDAVVGTLHDDHIIGNSGANKIWGLDGNDALWGEGGKDKIWAGEGNDYLHGGSGNDGLAGEDGHDHIWGDGGRDNITGGGGNDEIEGGSGNDVISGGSGNDTIDGGFGNDVIDGGSSDDVIDGGSRNDRIHTGSGDDTVDGGSGRDNIYVSGFGNNRIDGGSGTDTLIYQGNSDVNVSLRSGYANRADGDDTIKNVENVQTGGGDDKVFGTTGDNVIKTGSGNDLIYTLGGDDHIRSGAGDDIVLGYGGDETMIGGSGQDHLRGSHGNDNLNGGSGSDLMHGGLGADKMRGGMHSDTFLWEDGDVQTDADLDIVKGFKVNSDKLAFGEDFFDFGTNGELDIDDVLFAWGVNGDTYLNAFTSEAGWKSIAVLENVNSTTMNQKIANGTIFDVEVSDVGNGGPGGFGTLDTTPVPALELDWGMIA